MLPIENRKTILKRFLNTIEGISNKEYQKRVWIRGEGPECDDFDETVCFFFDDGDYILDNYKDFWITDIQYQILMEFSARFEEFADNNHSPEEFIDTPEWNKIVEMAKDVLKAFNYKDDKHSSID